LSTSPRGTRYRDLLVIILPLSTGALDAATFLRLGKVFSSVITGNLALLGVAAGRRDGALALYAGLALGGYAVGVVLGTPFARTPESDQSIWPRQVTVTLAVELAVLLAFSVLWLVSGQHGTANRVTLLILSGAAMGVQSAATRRLGEMSTTYLTSTLTGLFSGLALRRMPDAWRRSLGVLTTALIGAVLGALAATQSPGWVPAAVLVPEITVLIGSLPAAA
jgi:uncharacterized membrane protein YoaK (UPF0700 family)